MFHAMNRTRLVATALLVIAAPPALADLKPNEAAGQLLAMEVGKGNCLACHAVPGDPQAVTSANIGPPLVGIRARFPQRDRLREQLRDPMQFNPDTVMPPFGKHKILTDDEIDKIVDYLYTL
jgi:L-cysteine S-thiosulfotransferase